MIVVNILLLICGALSIWLVWLIVGIFFDFFKTRIWTEAFAEGKKRNAPSLPARSDLPTPATNPTWLPPQARFPARVNVVCTRCGCARAGTFCSQCGLRLLHHTGGQMLAADYMAEERRTKPTPPEDPEWHEVMMERTVVIEPGLPPVMTRRYVPR